MKFVHNTLKTQHPVKKNWKRKSIYTSQRAHESVTERRQCCENINKLLITPRYKGRFRCKRRDIRVDYYCIWKHLRQTVRFQKRLQGWRPNVKILKWPWRYAKSCLAAKWPYGPKFCREKLEITERTIKQELEIETEIGEHQKLELYFELNLLSAVPCLVLGYLNVCNGLYLELFRLHAERELTTAWCSHYGDPNVPGMIMGGNKPKVGLPRRKSIL